MNKDLQNLIETLPRFLQQQLNNNKKKEQLMVNIRVNIFL